MGIIIRLGILILTCLYISEKQCSALEIPGKEEQDLGFSNYGRKPDSDPRGGAIWRKKESQRVRLPTRQARMTPDRRPPQFKVLAPMVGPDDNPKNQNRAGVYPGGVLVGGQKQLDLLTEFSKYLDEAAVAAIAARRDSSPARNRDFTPVFVKDGKPASEFMIGVLTAKSTTGKSVTFVATSGTVYEYRKTNIRAQSPLARDDLIPLAWKRNGVIFVNGQVTGKPVFNVSTRRGDPAGAVCTKDCAAQKLFHALAEYVQNNRGFTIGKPRDISMTERWYKTPTSRAENRNYDQNQAVSSCAQCVGTLPLFTRTKGRNL